MVAKVMNVLEFVEIHDKRFSSVRPEFVSIKFYLNNYFMEMS